MAKIKTTMKYIQNVWGNVYRCGYCDLQYIMRYEDPIYYNCGVYGWNCDIYCDFKTNTAITTGYRNMRGRVIPHEIIERYSNIAKAIMENGRGKSYDEIKEELDQNRRKFFDELVNVC